MAVVARIFAFITNEGAPLLTPANDPTIWIMTDLGTAIVTDDAMTDLGKGVFMYELDTTINPSRSYACRIDAGAGQTTPQERYQFVSFSGQEVENEEDIPIIAMDAASAENLAQQAATAAQFNQDVLVNRAVTTLFPNGSRRVDFYDDAGTSIIDSITISANGLERTNP